MLKNILCIDDSKDTRQKVKEYLEHEGYNVQEAVDGIDGLNKISQIDACDLFVVDLDMPNMDGLEFIKEVRKQPSYNATPILALTLNSDDPKNCELHRVGANAWLVKPFDPPLFLKVIDIMIKG